MQARHHDPSPAVTLVTARDVTLVPVENGWELGARCRSEDPTLFFGPNRFEPKRERLTREAAAKAICTDCPALQACREHALLHAEPYGVWGGLGESDRRSIIAAREGRIARTA